MMTKLSNLLGYLQQIEEDERPKHPDSYLISLVRLFPDGSGSFLLDFGRITLEPEIYCRANSVAAAWDILLAKSQIVVSLPEDLYFFQLLKYLDVKRKTDGSSFRFFFLEIYSDGSGRACGQIQPGEKPQTLYIFNNALELIHYLTGGTF